MEPVEGLLKLDVWDSLPIVCEARGVCASGRNTQAIEDLLGDNGGATA